MLFLSNIVLRNISFGLALHTCSQVKMSKPLLFIIIGIFVSLEFLQSNANAENSKRLLLNDPDIVHARLSQLEKKQQEMTGQILQLQGVLSSEKAKTSILEQTIHTQQSKFSFLIVDIHYLK